MGKHALVYVVRLKRYGKRITPLDWVSLCTVSGTLQRIVESVCGEKAGLLADRCSVFKDTCRIVVQHFYLKSNL